MLNFRTCVHREPLAGELEVRRMSSQPTHKVILASDYLPSGSIDQRRVYSMAFA